MPENVRGTFTLSYYNSTLRLGSTRINSVLLSDFRCSKKDNFD